ncbi:MAG: hypothetical protein JNJ75_13445 [Cyclobacteriaceae bacterium]|nr:hypothetical protein [Cyclobacteriaceae bacterium]
MLKRIILFIPVIFLSACLEESSEKIDKKAFTRIYDNSEFYSSFYAIDMKQTSDGGYLILGGKTEVVKEGGEPQNVNTPLGVYLLKTDELGNIVTELQVDEAYAYPIGKLNQIGENFYFFCMDAGTNAILVSVDQSASSSAQTTLSTSLSLPLASATTLDGSNLLLLSYDNGTQETVMTQVSTDGGVSNETRFYTGAESPIDNLVIRHANREGTQFPFSVGQVSAGTYFFNGFIDYTFSLVFTSLGGDEDVDGIVNGQQENAGFSNVLPVSGQTFAISTYNFGFNFLKPNATLNMTATTSVTDIQSSAFSFPELESNARVKAIRAVVKGKNVIIFGSNTKSGQIGLYMYDEATGEFISSKYLGYSNPFEIAALVRTTDGDFVVAGTTYIAGRLPRFCLIKVPEGEIKD